MALYFTKKGGRREDMKEEERGSEQAPAEAVTGHTGPGAQAPHALRAGIGRREIVRGVGDF